eukprot:3699261-Amphidinium_carterae.1
MANMLQLAKVFLVASVQTVLKRSKVRNKSLHGSGARGIALEVNILFIKPRSTESETARLEHLVIGGRNLDVRFAVLKRGIGDALPLQTTLAVRCCGRAELETTLEEAT